MTAEQSVQRVLVHDFSGHPFQVQLARELGRKGYVSTHLFCPSFQTPRGNVGRDEDAHDEYGTSDLFRSIPIPLWRPFAKYSGPRRLLQEIEYGIRAARATLAERPDVVLTANTPLIAAVIFQLVLLSRGLPIVFWQQDVYSVAMDHHLKKRGGVISRVAGQVLIYLERWLLRTSKQVVVISEDFLETLDGWGIDLDRVSVVENWAPLDEIPAGCRPNAWSKRHGVRDDELVFLYSGSLGLKHEPSILLDLSRSFAHRRDVRVIVASEGRGAAWLEGQLTPEDRLELLPFQPYEDLPDMLASADVLLALLEPHAGAFSVPSKVLTYHCAGRPILGAVPTENLAARTVVRNGSGTIVSPGDAQRFASEAKRLASDADLRERMGAAGRNYAERAFNITTIGDEFEVILGSAVEGWLAAESEDLVPG